MKHEVPNQFHATPQRSARAMSAATVARNLHNEFRPAEQARTDALRHDDDPLAHAAHFRERVEIRRGTECAQIRTDALGLIAQNSEAAGALAVAVDPAEVNQVIEQANIGLEKIEIELDKEADKSIGLWRHTRTAFDGWCDRSGARLRHVPFPSPAKTWAILAIAGFGELWGTAQLLDGQAVAGAPSPYALGFLFASASIAWGIIGACGTSLAADKRAFRHWLGILVVAIALALWVITAILAAHMRACVEAGGAGTVDEILASLHQGMLRAFASPMALLLVAASAAATAAAWVKWFEFLGSPYGHRARDRERRWAESQLHQAEGAHRAAITQLVAKSAAGLHELEKDAWQPVGHGRRLEHEVGLALVQARECFEAVDRITRSMNSEYVATFRRLRSGVDVSAAAKLSPIADEVLGDTSAIHNRVEMLARAATEAANAIAAGNAELRRLEVTHIRKVEERYASTRNTRRILPNAPAIKSAIAR